MQLNLAMFACDVRCIRHAAVTDLYKTNASQGGWHLPGLPYDIINDFTIIGLSCLVM